MYDVKAFKGRGWLMENVLGNWNLSATYTFQSPEYATVQSGIDSNLNNDSAGDRAVVNPAGAAPVSTGVTPIDATGTAVPAGSLSLSWHMSPTTRMPDMSRRDREHSPTPAETDSLAMDRQRGYPDPEAPNIYRAQAPRNRRSVQQPVHHPEWTGYLLNDVFPNAFTNS